MQHPLRRYLQYPVLRQFLQHGEILSCVFQGLKRIDDRGSLLQIITRHRNRLFPTPHATQGYGDALPTFVTAVELDVNQYGMAGAIE